MAWLSGLAGKAEHLLNKIDKNTAAALNKEKSDQLAEVMWMPPSESPENIVLDPSINFQYTALSSIETPPHSSIETPSHSSINSARDDELITYLNLPVLTPTKSVRNSENGDLILHLSPGEPNLQVEHDCSDTSSVRSVDAVLNVEELVSHSENFGLMNIELNHTNGLPDVVCENIVDESSNVKEIKPSFQDDEHDFTRQKIEQDKLLTSNEDSVTKKRLQMLQKDVENKKGLLDKQQTDYQKEINALRDKLQSFSVERTQFSKRISELQSTLDRNRTELNSTRSELEQHRARALKTLQEKEKLIVELRGNANAGLDEATVMELNQLRQERDVLREENEQISEQLRLAREEFVAADLTLENMRQKVIEVSKQAQESIAVERRKRIDAEEDARIHTEEARTLKEELTLQEDSTSLKLRKQETEIARLRTKLSAAATPSSEVESRLSILTQTLVLKQQALESLTTERNALRLQLEKIEHEYRNSRKNHLYNSVNDSDDAQAQVPTFLMETPFDTGVTRRVKRAYSSLDAISIRTGVFLRRYPLARILVLIYMGLLQFWVLVVLLSQSPEAH